MKYQFTSHSKNTSFSFARSIKFLFVRQNAILKLSHNYYSVYPFFRSKWCSTFHPLALKNNVDSPNNTSVYNLSYRKNYKHQHCRRRVRISENLNHFHQAKIKIILFQNAACFLDKMYRQVSALNLNHLMYTS